MRILYVEDNQANLFLIQRVARMGGHEVIAYSSAEPALENFTRDHPDLVLMDVQLSGEMSGLDAVRKLRADGHQTPIVAVTAYAMVGDRDRCLEAGCNGYLSKPLPVTELVEMIKKYGAQAPKPAAPPSAAEAKPEASGDAPTAGSSSSPEATAKPDATADSSSAQPAQPAETQTQTALPRREPTPPAPDGDASSSVEPVAPQAAAAAANKP